MVAYTGPSNHNRPVYPSTGKLMFDHGGSHLHQMRRDLKEELGFATWHLFLLVEECRARYRARKVTPNIAVEDTETE